MKAFTTTFLILFASLVLVSCQKDEPIVSNPPTTPDTIEILMLGDSRVAGNDSEFESYRYELWKNLVTNNWDFDFIGNKIDSRSYPGHLNQSFDPQHQAEGGATTQWVLDVLATESFERTPEVALVGIGGNDVDNGETVAQTLNNIRSIVTELRRLNPNVIIFMEQIAPAHSDYMRPELLQAFPEFNSGMDQLGLEMSTTASPVYIVDMSTGWNDSYMADLLHYNAAGAKVVADRYYAAMAANISR